MKKFDLNIEKILEDWEMRHAIREIKGLIQGSFPPIFERYCDALDCYSFRHCLDRNIDLLHILEFPTSR